MTHIESIKIVRTGEYPGSHVLKVGSIYGLSSVNLIVGEQGCGKSTLLSMIQSNDSGLKLKLSENATKNGIESFYFDSERDNPRIKDPNCYTKINGENVGIGYGGALLSRWKSHGEVLVNFTVNAISKAENCVVLLDEPELGLSIRNQYRLVEEIRKATERGVQFIIATHCYVLIDQFDLVISLEHGKYMSGEKFLNLNRE